MLWCVDLWGSASNTGLLKQCTLLGLCVSDLHRGSVSFQSYRSVRVCLVEDVGMLAAVSEL